MNVLNNLVIELLNVQIERRSDERGSYEFYNPRDGWVFIASTAEVYDGELHIVIDSDKPEDSVIAHTSRAYGTNETMLWLSAGKHRINILYEGDGRIERIIARAVPELIFCKFQYDPHVTEHGPYDWRFLERYVLPHVNTIVGSGAYDHGPFVERWKRNGGRWLIETGNVWAHKGKTPSADDVFERWSSNLGLQEPLLDGIIVDEFGAGDRDEYPAWTEAIERIAADRRFHDKTYYAYCGGGMYRSNMSRRFIETLLRCGYRIALERYLSERPDEESARDFIREMLVEEMLRWKEVFPNCERQMVICFGYMSAPPESLNIDPSVDYKVFMDMQFNVIANDPAFSDLFGVMEYTSGYADEETVRWAAALYRHYCLEGHTDMLSDRYGFRYRLDHVENPDFAHGLNGWRVIPAEEGSIGVKVINGFSWLEGRYPRTPVGDTVLWMKRKANRPNTVAQRIRNLKPGKLYSLKMFSADHRDLVEGRSERKSHVLTIKLDGAELIPDRCFQYIFPNCYSHHLGPFNREHRFWVNYHFLLFRPRSETAQLTITDWACDSEPGAPIGQELILNFIEVQPYFEP